MCVYVEIFRMWEGVPEYVQKRGIVTRVVVRAEPVYPVGMREGSLLSLWGKFVMMDDEGKVEGEEFEKCVAFAIVSGRKTCWGGLVSQSGLWLFRSDLGMSQVATGVLERDVQRGSCRVEVY